MSEWPIFEEPPKRRGLFGATDEIADWLDQVREFGAFGEWLRFPTPVKKEVIRRLKRGKHGAKRGEFEIRYEPILRKNQYTTYRLYARIAQKEARTPLFGGDRKAKGAESTREVGGGSETIVKDRHFGVVSQAQLRLYERYGVSPDDHQRLEDEFDGDRKKMMDAVVERSSGGRYAEPVYVEDPF